MLRHRHLGPISGRSRADLGPISGRSLAWVFTRVPRDVRGHAHVAAEEEGEHVAQALAHLVGDTWRVAVVVEARELVAYVPAAHMHRAMLIAAGRSIPFGFIVIVTYVSLAHPIRKPAPTTQ